MSTASIREQLSRKLNELPDDIVAEIADFTAFILARHRLPMPYLEWTEGQWRAMALSQFLRDADDDVEYTINDAEEVLIVPSSKPGWVASRLTDLRASATV